ncbi:MAG: trigger factor [Oricola sp.]|nr:trigger factor [Oricola sp.]
MQVSETLNEGLKREIKVVVPKADLQSRLGDRLEDAKGKVQLKGFRPGKVPVQHLRKMYGKSFMAEIVNEILNETPRSVLADRGEKSATQPEIDMTEDEAEAQKVLSGDADFEFSLKYEVIPPIEVKDFSSIKVTREVVEIPEEEVEEQVKRIAQSAVEYETKSGKAADGDRVTMDYVGKVDGEAFEGGSAEDYPLVLGSGSFIPGFEEQLVGAKAGEEKDVTVTFPEEYQAEHLAGKEAVFSCTIKEVKEPVAAELDDELAKKFGAESLDALKEQIRERLEAEYAGAARQVTKRALLDKLDEMVKFDLPPTLVEAEAKQIAHQLWHEENPDVEGHDHPEIEPTDEHNKLAERRVRLGLLLAELGQKAEVQVSDAEMTQAIMNQARQYPGQERQFFEFVQQNQQMQQQMRAPIFEDKVVDYILELAEVTEKEVSKEELQKAVEELDEE